MFGTLIDCIHSRGSCGRITRSVWKVDGIAVDKILFELRRLSFTVTPTK